uniref:DDE Tnp4 domain-containing protein n=1 Tax=Helianthus annuus TaxID=4232 RepID=A0A251UF39_HELAN
MSGWSRWFAYITDLEPRHQEAVYLQTYHAHSFASPPAATDLLLRPSSIELPQMETNDGRQQWTHEAIKCMLETCLEEIGRVGRNGQSFATGGNQWTSTQTSGVSSSPQVQTLQIEGASVHLEDDDGDSHEQSFPMGDEDPINNEGPSVRPNDDSEVRPKKKAKTSKNSITLDDLASDMRDALKHMVKNMEGPSIDECYEKLKSVGLEPIDPLFLGAFNIFGQSTYMRQAWMTLPLDPEVLKEWIKMTGITLGMFKMMEFAKEVIVPTSFNPNPNIPGHHKRLRKVFKLRNVIERAYGVLKACFPILKKMAPFSLVTQRNITVACFALHNFIRKEGLSDDLFDEYDHPNVRLQDGDEHVQDGGENREEEVPRHGSSADREFMSQLRDQIAQELMQNNVL